MLDMTDMNRGPVYFVHDQRQYLPYASYLTAEQVMYIRLVHYCISYIYLCQVYVCIAYYYIIMRVLLTPMLLHMYNVYSRFFVYVYN